MLSGAPLGSSYSWNFGSGFATKSDTVYEFFLDPKVVDVEVEVTFPSGSTCTVEQKSATTILAKPNPTFEISRNKLCYGPDSVMITNTTPITKTISWIIDGTNYPVGQQNQLHYFKSIGLKDLSMIVTDTFGCRSVRVFKDIAVIHPVVELDFDADTKNGCVTKLVQITPTIDPKGETITSYNWQFEGANRNTYRGYLPPKLTFITAGEFDIEMGITTANGCKHVLVKEDFLRFGDSLKLDVQISDTTVCLKNSFNVRTPIDVDGNYVWTFSGNPNVTKTKDNERTVKYNSPGAYDISLELSYNSCYSKVNLSKAVVVKEVVAKFSSKDNYHCKLPHVAHMDNESYSSDSSKLMYKWTYTNNSGVLIDSSFNEMDSFSSSDWGRYQVQLEVEDGNGCRDTMKQGNFIRTFKILPNFLSEQRIGCVNQEITVKNKTNPSSYLSSDTFSWVLYNKDDSTIISENKGPSFTHKFTEAGFYDVKLYAGNRIGCRDSIRRSAYLEIIEPKHDFQVSDTIICRDQGIQMEALTTPTYAPFEFRWKIGNTTDPNHFETNYDTARKASFTFRKPGYYDVTCIHRIVDGCYDTLTRPELVRVNGISGTLNLDQNNGCNGMTLRPKFTVDQNVHYGSTSDTLIYRWSASPSGGVAIDDPESANPVFTFNQSGQFKIRLLVLNSVDCGSNLSSEDITVGVIADFSLNKTKVCANANIDITNTSRLKPTSYRWDVIGNGKYNLVTSGPITFTPLEESQYKIQLIAGKNGQCYDTIERTVESIVVTSSFELADTFLFCAPAYAQFFATSQNADSFFWDFGDGTKISTTDLNIANVYERNTGNKKGFKIVLISKSNYGCSDTLIRPNAVSVVGPVPRFKLENNVGCDPLDVVFKDQGNDVYSFKLDYGDGSNLDSLNLNLHNYVISNASNTQQFIPKVFSSDSLGCSAVFESPDTVTVFKSPVADAISENYTSCLPFNIKLKDQSQNITKRDWHLNDSLISNKATDDIEIKQPGTNNLILIVSNQFNCTDTVKNVFIAHTPPKFALISPKFCLDQTSKILIDNESSSPMATWTWELNGKMIHESNNSAMNEYDVVIGTPGLNKLSLIGVDVNDCVSESSIEYNVTSFEDIPWGTIRRVTANESNDLIIEWDVVNPENLSRSKIIDGNGSIVHEELVNKSQQILINMVDVSKPNCYTMSYINDCGVEGPGGNNHCAVILNVEKGRPFTLSLSWTHYQGWDSIESYRIMRSENGMDYTDIGFVDGNTNEFVDTSLCHKTYRYFVVAIYQNLESESNRSTNSPDFQYNEIPIDMESVSVENQGIAIKWQPSSFEKVTKYIINKWDSSGSNQLGSFAVSPSTLNIYDEKVDVNKRNYRYTVRSEDHCSNLSIKGLAGRSILLSGNYIDQASILNWTSYEKWRDGVKRYVIQLKTQNGFEEIGEVDGNSLNYTDVEIHDEALGEYCYRIIAHSFDEGIISISNEICINGASIVWIPNAFSPNEDDLNSVFKPTTQFVNLVNDGTYQTYEFKIYNRWGEEIFETNSVYAGWDGSYHSAPCPSETYMYLIRVKGLDNVLYNQKGLVRLMR